RPGRRWSAPVIAAAVCVLALAASVTAANPGTATLSNGAQLSVSIGSPATGTEYSVPPAGSTVDVPVSGTASIGLGSPDASIVYVMDPSGSTGNPGGACGTVLACEKAFFVALNNAAVADGSVADVGLVQFDSAPSIVLGLTPPADPGVNTAINSPG